MMQPAAVSGTRVLERVVVLVDVKVLMEQEDRRNCAAQIFSSVVTILEKSNEHSRGSTLWGYAFFDSSRSPVASDSTLGRLVAGDPTRERFDGVSQNLEKFGKVLETVIASDGGFISAGKSRADCLVRTLAAVVSAFQWDPLFASDSSSSDEDLGSYLYDQTTKPEPNLVILFSSLPTYSGQLASFLDVQSSPVDSNLEEKLLYEFCSRFRSVQSVLDSKNIECCWIDVPARQNVSNSGLVEASVNLKPEQSVARRCLSKIAWNFVSLSVVANIVNLVPLRLIWNMIAYLAPKFLDRPVVAHCEAGVPFSMIRRERNDGDPVTFFRVEVQPWSITLKSSSNAGHVPRLSRLFGNENLDVSEISSTSSRAELVFLSRLSRSHSFQLSTERYLVLQRPSEAYISHTDTEAQQSDQRSAELKAWEPTWPGFLISLEGEGSVALVTVSDGGCNCQAILEPFTPNSALLTVLDSADVPLGRKHVPTRLSCHLSRVSDICMKEKLEQYAKDRGRLPNIGDSREAGTSGVATGDVNDFERSFDSTVLKVVKEKRRGSVLFRSGKKHGAEWGQTLDSTHDLFQGTTSEPEKVSWQEYWRRVIKKLQRAHSLLDKNCTLSSSLGVIKSSISLSSVQHVSENMIHFHVTGTSVEGLETLSDLGPSRQGSRSTSRLVVRHIRSKSCSSISSTPPAVVGVSPLSPTTFLGHSRPLLSASPHTFHSSSRGKGDGVQAEREVLPTQRAHQSPSLIGTTVNEVASCETSAGYSFMKQIVQSVLTSEGVDLHLFAKSVVTEAYKVLYVDDDEVVAKGTSRSKAASSQTSDASVAVRIKELLLKRPKHLLSKYKDLLSSTTTTRSKASIVAEKLREHELQILFRLEILVFEGEFHDKARHESLTRDICKLLDNIQFHLVGGGGSEGSLQQYCDRVIVSRYKVSLPSTMSRIFSEMELSGYCDPSLSTSVYFQGLQTSETRPSSEDVSQSEQEATDPSSDPQENIHGEKKLLLPSRRRLSSEGDGKSISIIEVITSQSGKSSGKENVADVQGVHHKQEKRHRKTYHFSSGAHNLLRVKAVKPRDHVAVKPRKIIHLSRTSASRTVDYNTKLQVTNAIRIPGKEEHVLQNRGKDFHIVCQTPNIKLGNL